MARPSLAGVRMTFPDIVQPVQIVNQNSGKCLDTAGAGTGNNVNVQQFDCIGVKNEEWWVIPVGNNRYQIRTGHIGRCLNRANGSSDNFTNVQQYSCAGSPQAEHWEFVSVSNGRPFNVWQIRAPGTNQCLDIAFASQDNGGNAHMFECFDGVANEEWRLFARQDANNVVMAKNSNLCLHISGASTANQASLLQSSCTNTGTHQRWIFQPAPGIAAPHDGSYFIKAKHSGKCLDVPGGSTADNLVIQQFDCNNGSNQRWSIIPDGETDYYQIKSSNTGKCLQASGRSTSSGASIVQTTCGSSSAQRWRVGYFSDRHIHQFRVARADGTGRRSLSENVINEMVTRMNSTYAKVGVRARYSAQSDTTDVDDDSLYNLCEGTVALCKKNNQMMAPDQCANLYAADFPGKIVAFPCVDGFPSFSDVGARYVSFVYPNPGTSANGLPSGTACQFNDTNLAHELGHYLGLNHTFTVAGDEAALSAWLQGAGDDLFRAFDGDGLLDTPPEPVLLRPPGPSTFWTCSSTAATATLSLQNSAGPVQVSTPLRNIIGYYYNRTKSISASQGAIVRALMGIRGM